MRRRSEVSGALVRLGGGGEEEPVSVATGTSLRGDDLREAGDLDLHAPDAEDAPIVPHGLEGEARHDEREVGARAVGRADEGLVGDDSLREESISRLIERLVAADEIEAEVFAHAPGCQDLIGFAREKEAGPDQEERSRRLCVAFAPESR